MNERTLFEQGIQDQDRPPDSKQSRPVGLPHNRTATSKAAAVSMRPAAIAQAARVYHFIAEQGNEGATDHEVQTELGLSGDSERPRRWSLERSGLIRDSGRKRKSPKGRDAIVWIVNEMK
ncbi:MAG: hypothetical protein HQ518_25645 [Rhodopirellula sp.]|nr:hypothetical protein [Rhodopirellula sp.]